MILAVSAPDDRQVGAVLDLLRERDVRVAHVDVPSLSADTAVELEDGRWTLRIGRRAPIPLSLARVGWWRRDPAPVVSRDLATLAEIDGAPVESSEALIGTLLAQRLDWITRPAEERSARLRPVVWRAATSTGLALPATLVTRDPVAAVVFRARHLDAGVTVAPLTRRADDWWHDAEPLDEDELADVVIGRGAESVLHRRVSGQDVRVISVGSELFAAEVTADEHGIEESDARPVALPETLRTAIRRTLRILGLGNAAVELRRDVDGVYWLIDVDPMPRWLLFEELSGLPVTTSMVEMFARTAHALTR